MSVSDQDAARAKTLFATLEEKFPTETVGGDKWYLVAISALTGAGIPEFAPELYRYIVAKPEFSTSDARKALVRRLREALVKCVPLVGIPKTLEAIFKISAVERPEDKDYTFTRKDWQCDEANEQRGVAWIDKLYNQNISTVWDRLEAHKDFEWLSKNITYGLCLSDRQILDDISTELVVLSAIMIQNLKDETAWHLRGTRRIGVSQQDVEKIQQSIEMIADLAGVSLKKVPRVAQIEHEV